MSTERMLIAGTTAAVGLHAAPLLLSIGAARRVLSPAWSGLGDPSGVALTFDDGPDPESTPRFIRELDRLGWTATFFLLGAMTRNHPGVARQLIEAGHEVAVHGDRNINHVARRPADVFDDLTRSTATIANATRTVPRWYRPPYGAVSWSTIAAVRRLDLQLVLWTTWGRDWRQAATPRSVHDDVMRGIEPGGTVLLHDSDCTSSPGSWEATLAALPLLAESLAERGLAVRPLRDHGVAVPRWLGHERRALAPRLSGW